MKKNFLFIVAVVLFSGCTSPNHEHRHPEKAHLPQQRICYRNCARMGLTLFGLCPVNRLA